MAFLDLLLSIRYGTLSLWMILVVSFFFMAWIFFAMGWWYFCFLSQCYCSRFPHNPTLLSWFASIPVNQVLSLWMILDVSFFFMAWIFFAMGWWYICFVSQFYCSRFPHNPTLLSWFASILLFPWIKFLVLDHSITFICNQNQILAVFWTVQSHQKYDSCCVMWHYRFIR